MQLVHVHLNFPGTTEEAFRHYEKVFGTRIAAMATYGDTPFAPDVPESFKKKIIHAQLPITEAVHLMGCDSGDGCGPDPTIGNNFSISIVAKDRAEADRAFAALSDGGKVRMPMGNAPWGPYFGMCTDKFNVQWMVSLPHPV
jgi:PhnB protein